MAEVADKITARENDAFLARWRAVLQWRSVRRIVVIAGQMCCGQGTRLANVRHVEALIPSVVRVTLCGGLHIWAHAQLCACTSCECMAYYITVVARRPQFEVGQSLWPHLNGATGSCLVRQRKMRSNHRSDLPESCRGCTCRSSGFFVRWRPQGPSRNRGEVPPPGTPQRKEGV